jgi:AcrR family transcriptional regulator
MLPGGCHGITTTGRTPCKSLQLNRFSFPRCPNRSADHRLHRHPHRAVSIIRVAGPAYDFRRDFGILCATIRTQDSMKTNDKALTRREPKQQRSQQTVEAVLEAVRRVLKRHGAGAVTTNRIAEAAGVSIGSLYQYFPDKQAIFTALHDRHVDEVRLVIERTMADCTSASLKDFTCELMEGLANVHADAELHEICSAAVPQGAHGFKSALHATFEQVISPADPDRYTPDEAKRMLFVLPHMVEALVHGATHQKQAVISRDSAKDEAIRTVLVYLNSCQGRSPSHY